MKFTSQVYTAVSGSIGGITYSHNRGGMYTRGRAIPTNPSTNPQQYLRNAFSYLAERWSNTLTAAQRLAWDTYAANVPVTDKLGQQINLTGQNMYIRSNVSRQQVNNIVGSAVLAIIDAGPTNFTLADTDPTAAFSMTAPSTGSLAFDDTADWCSEDDAILMVFIGQPQNAAINFFKGPYRLSGILQGDSTTPITTPQAVVPVIPFTAGQSVFSYARIGRADGRLSPAFNLAKVLAT